MEALLKYKSYIEEEITRLSLNKEPQTLYAPMRHILGIGGKRIRPALALFAAEFYGAKKEEALYASLAIELFHNFTLIHDDIMDEAPLRRGVVAVHEKYGINTAILSGDALFAIASELLLQSPVQYLPQLLALYNRTAVEVCEGQQMDMDFEQRTDVSTEEYTEMIRLKTSVLLGASAKMGAILGGADEESASNYYAYALNIGLAFQLMDDLLDAYGESAKVGKQVGGDILNAKKTLLYLLALDGLAEEESALLEELYQLEGSPEKLKEVMGYFEKSGAEAATRAVVDVYYEKAIVAAALIARDDEELSSLKHLASTIVYRTF